MEKRPWYTADWRKVALIVAIPVMVSLASLVYLRAFSPAKVACVLESETGELVKAWDADCDGAKLRLVAK